MCGNCQNRLKSEHAAGGGTLSELMRRLPSVMRRPAVRAALSGIVVTLVLTVIVITAVLLTPGADVSTISDNAPLIGALLAIGGVATTQLVNIALEDQRAHEAALRAYLEHIGELVRDKKLSRLKLDTKEVRTVARAQTLAVLKGLRRDPDRKRILMLFLSEAELLEKDRTILSLAMADLSGADLGGLGPPRGGRSYARRS